jgi:hypothetical protein
MKVPKQTIETTKTVVIAVLITGVIAFVGGMQYQSSLQAQTNAQVKQAVAGVETNANASVETPKK